MRSSRRLVLAAVLTPDQAIAQAARVPTKDIPNTRDNPLLRRYDGSFIVDYAQRAFEEFELPTAELKQVADKKDARNNDVFAPTAAEALEGRFTCIVYVAQANRTPLEVISNYQEEIVAKGGMVFFSCRDEACGGDNRESSAGGGYCAVIDWISGPRYAAMRPPTSGGNARNVYSPSHVEQGRKRDVFTHQGPWSSTCNEAGGSSVLDCVRSGRVLL